MKKRLLPCLAVLFLLLTACGVGHMGVHALEDITDADIVANEMGIFGGSLAELQRYLLLRGELGELPRGGVPLDPAGKRSADGARDLCRAGVRRLPGGAGTARRHCGGAGGGGEHGGGAGGSTWMAVASRRGRWGLHRPMGIINTPKKPPAA